MNRISEFFKLNLSDFYKAVMLVILGTFLGLISQAVNGCLDCTPPIEAHIPTLAEFQAAFSVAWKAGVIYLFKNLLTNSDGKLFQKEIK